MKVTLTKGCDTIRKPKIIKTSHSHSHREGLSFSGNWSTYEFLWIKKRVGAFHNINKLQNQCNPNHMSTSHSLTLLFINKTKGILFSFSKIEAYNRISTDMP